MRTLVEVRLARGKGYAGNLEHRPNMERPSLVKSGKSGGTKTKQNKTNKNFSE
jgi:hypothetical protein